MRAMSLALRHELVGLSGVIERNIYLVKRYIWWDIAFFIWTVANTLTIVFIAKGIPAVGGHIDVNRVTTVLLVGAVIWAYLGIIFEILTETVAWERWEGTIEYTFMAPLARPVHLFGMGLFAVVYGVVRAVLLFGVVAAFFGLHLPQADYGAALVLLVVASISFIGIGMMTAILQGAGLPELWGDICPLLVIGAVSVPLGLWVFRTGERYAKKHGKLKRSG